MHPILFRIGSFHLPTYGLLLALALLAGLYTAIRLGRREGINSGYIIDLSTWLIITGLIGAKIYMILTGWRFYTAHPGQIFSLDTLEAGGGFYGGFIAATLFALWYVNHQKLPLLKVFDVFAPAIALGQCIGRIGCFAAGDDYGKVAAHSSLAVVFTSHYSHQMTGVPIGIPLYPVQLFESGATLIIFLILLWFFARKKLEGQIFAMYIMMYGAARIVMEFYRGDPDRGFFFHGAVSTAQLIGALAIVTGAIMIYFLHRRARPSAAHEETWAETKRVPS
ncbi:MAG: prolipoprotein diacylglyceryl transferase [Terriglobia bacterium]